MQPITVRDLGSYLREQRKHAQLSLRQLAEQAGVSNPYLSQIERGLRKPSAEILQQIAKGLRISAEQLYVQAEILDERSESDLAVEQALTADTAITERQRRMLLDIYRSFRAENLDRDGATSIAAPEQPEPEPTEPEPEPVTAKAAPRPRRAAGTTTARPKKS